MFITSLPQQFFRLSWKTRVPSASFSIAILFIASSIACRAQNAAITEQSIAQSRSAGTSAIKLSTDFEWIAAPSDDLNSPGAHTLHLLHCPPGVFGNEPEYWVFLSGSGNDEAVKVTGGTCRGDSAAGTLSFTTTRHHAGGYRLSSASSGLQEASLAARWSTQTPPTFREGGKVLAPPGEIQILAPVSFLTRNQTVDFSGSVLECWVTDDACLKVGSAANYNLTLDVTLINPRGRPTQMHSHQPMIAVYGQKTRILNLMTMPGVKLPQGSATFGSYVSVISDQAFLLDGLDSTAGWGLECTSEFCGAAIVAPGPFNHPSNAALGWIKHAQISLQCMGNGIDWQSGNTLRVSDSIIQGYSQFGVRSGTPRGGYGPTMIDNMYMEDSGTCPNPLGNVGAAGVLMLGNELSFRGGEGPAGHVPQFAKSGTTRYEYFVVARHAKYGPSNPLYAGFAMTNGSGTIAVTVPDVPGASSFDLLRMPNAGGRVEAPSGTGAFEVGANISRSSACSNGVCSFNDTQKAPSSYSVASPTYFPKLAYWPGALVLTTSTDSDSVLSSASAVLSELNNYTFSETNTSGSTAPAILSEHCLVPQGSPLWMSCYTAALPPAVLYDQNALLLASKPNNDGGLKTNLKGRINLSSSGSGPSHFITLVDSDFSKTVASSTNRPSNDAADTYIGYDEGSGPASSIGLSFGAPRSISNYVGNTGDGKNWKERLTAKDKTFAVPVVIQNGSSLTVGGGTPISQMKTYTVAATSVSVPAQACADGKASANGLNAGEQVLGLTPPRALGNLALNVYAASANVLTLHFCNPSPKPVDSPAGSYVFLGVR